MTDGNTNAATIKVWDPLLRIFHWSLVLSFTLAFITEDEWLDLHVEAGYLVLFLIAFRLLWGVIGTRPARFSSFIQPPRVVLAHFKSMLLRQPKHYLGHNPVAAVMVVALMLGVLSCSVSGLMLLAAEGQGPLAATFLANWQAERLETLHELVANFTLILVFAHLAGVAISSLLERENLVLAMFTGRKKSRSHWQDQANAERGYE